jgi:hypothetical protein
VDSFGQKLDGILAADLTNDALSQGSLDTIPLGPLATLMPLLQMAGQLNDPAIKRALKQVRGCSANAVSCHTVPIAATPLQGLQASPHRADAFMHVCC